MSQENVEMVRRARRGVPARATSTRRLPTVHPDVLPGIPSRRLRCGDVEAVRALPDEVGERLGRARDDPRGVHRRR